MLLTIVKTHFKRLLEYLLLHQFLQRLHTEQLHSSFTTIVKNVILYIMLTELVFLAPHYYRGPARGGSRVACLNLKMSRVAVLSHFTSLSVVELKENCLSLSELKFLH